MKKEKTEISEEILRNIYLRKLALGELQGPPTGYPRLDKPYLKYHSEEAITSEISKDSAYINIVKANANNLDKVALIYGDTTISYQKMFEKIDLVASSLKKIGIKKGDIVSVCIANIPEVAYIFYGLNKLGAICDFMDPRASQTVMMEHLNLAKSQLLLTISDCYPIFNNIREQTSLKTIISINPLETILESQNQSNTSNLGIERKYTKQKNLNWQEFLSLGDKNSAIQPDTDIFSPITILHTGGSTGEPKGALLTNYNLNSLANQWLNSGIKYEKGDKLLSLMPPFVSFGLAANLHVPLSNSMQIILIPKYEPEKTLDLIQYYKPNCVPASPAHWEQVYLDKRSRHMDWSFLKVALMGGDILNPIVENGLNQIFAQNNGNCKFVMAYGMTETTTALSMAFNSSVNINGSVGAPLAKTTIAIIDPDTQKELGYNQEGEICALTPNKMLKYYKKDKETKEILRKHDDQNVWVHTGDMGIMTKDGILYIKGRLKRIIIRFDGIKIYPIDIETKLIQSTLVKKCAVVGIKDEHHLHGENPVAYIVKKGKYSSEHGREELKKYCENNLIDYSVPVDYIFVDDLPYTRNGKVDSTKLIKSYRKSLKK